MRDGDLLDSSREASQCDADGNTSVHGLARTQKLTPLSGTDTVTRARSHSLTHTFAACERVRFHGLVGYDDRLTRGRCSVRS
jgi:hypothetical protein